MLFNKRIGVAENFTTLQVVVFFTLVLIMPSIVEADEIVIGLNNQNQAGVAGDTLQFFGSVSNVGVGAATLDSDPFEYFIVGNSGPLNLDIELPSAPYLLPGQILPQGFSTGNILLFSVTIPMGSPTGVSFGEVITIYVNSTGNMAQASIPFTVSVQQVASTVPEPATITLLGIGLAAAGGLIHKRRQRLH